MKSFTRRKITAVAVSLMLVAVIVTTGILCAPNFEKGNIDTEIENLAYTPYAGNYAVDRIGKYDSTNSAVAHIEMDGFFVNIQYPTEIYIDKEESLDSAGYYFYMEVCVKQSAAAGNTRTLWVWLNTFGAYGSEAFGTASEPHAYDSLPANDAGNKAKVMHSTFADYTVKDGKAKALNISNGQANRPAGSNAARARNNTIGFSSTDKTAAWNNNKWTGWSTYFMSGTPQKFGDFEYSTYSEEKTDSSNVVLAGHIDGSNWNGYWNSAFSTVSEMGETYNYSTDINSTFQWFHKDNDGNVQTTSDAITAPFTNGINISVHTYDKTPLLEALDNLKTSYNEFNGLIINKSEADALIAETETLLRTRKTTNDEVTAQTEKVKNFEIQVARPNTTATGWQFGADEHKGSTHINTLWGTYKETLAKYFDLDINNTVVNPLNENEKEVINTPVNSYSDAVVRDAGNYEITFTPKSADASKGIYNKVAWSTNNDSMPSATMKLTIQRASLPLSFASDDPRQYTGSAEIYKMLITGKTVQLADGMDPIAESSKVVVKLSNVPLDLYHANWNTKSDTLSFTEVGKHIIYARVEAKNHYPVTGSYEVEISKANVVVELNQITKNKSGGTLTYGDALLSSEDLLSLGVKSITINGKTQAGFVTKENINSMITAGVFHNGEFLSGNLVNAGSYSVVRNQYKAVDASSVLDGKASSIKTWGDRMTLSFSNPDSIYVIAKKEVTLTWSDHADKYYNGESGHRPSATVNGLVAGGEVLDVNAVREILTGTEATAANGNTVVIPDGYAGVRNIDGKNYFVPLNDAKNAVWAGTYWLKVKYTSNNYTVREGDETVSFEILPRDLYITAKDRTRTYAESMNSVQLLNHYQHTLFDGNDIAEEKDKVYEITSGSLASGDAADQVFRLNIVGVETTGANSSDPNDKYYVVGTHVGALRVEHAVVDQTRVIDYVVNSYNIIETAGTFTVNKATIRSTRQDIQLTFNGEEQPFVLPNNQGVIEMKGFEANNRDDIQITYSKTLDGNYSSVDIPSWRDYNTSTNSPRIVYYKISAPNHEDFSGNFEAVINKLELKINVGAYKVIYGDKLPTANEMISKFNISYSSAIDTAEYKFSIDNRIAFYISHAGEEVSDSDKLGAGKYSLNHKAQSGELLSNYIISYNDDSNVEAFVIDKKTVYVDWKQTGEGWLEDGVSYLYDSTLPKIRPVARKYVKVDGSNFETSDTKVDATWTENVVYDDSIVLAEQDMGGSIFKDGGYPTKKTVLTNPKNIENYNLFNDTEVFFIAKRQVIIDVFDISREYGMAKTISMGQLIAAGEVGANWKYHTDNAENMFISDHYMNWSLDSIAQAGNENNYVDYREEGYPIVLGYRSGVSADGEIVRNYEITVYRAKPIGVDGGEYEYILSEDHSNVATFMITKSTRLGLSRREFNFDAKPEANEPDGINISNDISSILKYVGATKPGDIAIQMSVIVNKNEETDDIPSGLDMTATEVHAPNAGRWYVWVTLENGNYEPFKAKVYINYLTNWVDIKLGAPIQVNYGDRVLTSAELFEQLGKNLVSISGIMDDNGNDQLAPEDAWAKLESDYISLYVGDGSTVGELDRNKSVGFYSVFMKTLDGVDTDSEDALHFRFVGDVIGNGNTSNIDVYEVIPRPIWIEWLDGEDGRGLNEYYGDHGDKSNSHKNYAIANVIDGDDVRVTIKYEIVEGGYKYGTHIHGVGTYKAVISAVTHQNYRVAEIGDVIYSIDGGEPYVVTEDDREKEFQIEKREITVTIKDRSLEYGSADARKEAVAGTGANNIESYLNSTTSYEIGGMGLYRGDGASSVFKLVAQLNDDGFNYIAAGPYAIKGEVVSGNYLIDFQNKDNTSDEGLLEITEAEFTISSTSFPRVYFDGSYHAPLENSALTYQFKGGEAEQNYAFENRNVTYKLINVSSDLEDETGWVSGEDFKFRHAGIYQFAVKVTAPNHKARIRTNLEFEIAAVNVTIDMPSKATKEYGKAIGNEKAVSDYIKAGTGITYSVTAGGNPVTIAGIDDAFIFYVVKGGENSADGGDATTANNFANSVGNYRVYHKFATLEGMEYDESGNYIVEYKLVDGARCNASAFVITPWKIAVEWQDSDGNIIANGYEYTYSGVIPEIHAYIRGTKWDESLGQQVEDLISLNISGLNRVNTNRATGIDKYTAHAVLDSTVSVANYELSYNVDLDYKIVPLNVDVTIFDNQEITYGFVGAPQWNQSNTAWQAEGGIMLTNPGIRLSLEGLPATGYVPVANYRITADWTNKDYEISFSEAYLHVVGADLDVRIQRNTVTYDGAAKKVDLKSYIGEDVANRVVIAGDVQWSSAKIKYSMTLDGDYSETIPEINGVTGDDGIAIYYKISLDNHKEKSGVFNLIINAMRIVIRVEGMEVVYGEPALTHDQIYKNVSIKSGELADGVTLEDLVEFSVAKGAHNVGNYRIIREKRDTEARDYFEVVLDDSDDQDQTPYHIIRRTITANWGDATAIYNGDYQLLKVVGFDNLWGDDKIEAPTYINHSQKDVGEYDVTIAVLANNPNYKVSEESRTVKYRILPREVEVVWSSERTFTYDGREHGLSATIGGLLFDDECDATVSAPQFSAGTHIASITSLTNKNYKATSTQEFTILPAEVNIVWDMATFEYNGNLQCPQAHVDPASLFGEDVCDVKVGGATANAGTHTATVIELLNKNYRLPKDGASCEFAISPKVITAIVWENTTLEYREINNTPQAQTPIAKGVGALSGDTVEFDVMVDEGVAINVGSYTARAFTIKNSNYTLSPTATNTSVSFSIKSAANEFVGDIVLPDMDGGLPALADFASVASKFGTATVKYYTDEALTKEYTENLSDAPKGKYYVVVMVEGNQNYDTISKVFEVDVKSGANVGLILGILIPVIILVAAAIVAVIVVKKKKGGKQSA